MKRLLVIGAGAIGGSIGGLLHAAGTNVVLVARGPHGVAIRERGLSVELPDGVVRATPPCVGDIAEVDPEPGDVALVATKLYDAETALEQLLAAHGSEIPIVCAFNGIDGERWSATRFGNVAAAMVWVHATHLHAGIVQLHGGQCRGVLDLGVVAGRDASSAIEMGARLRGVGFDSRVVDDITRWKYAKLVANLGGTAHALVTGQWQRVASAARAEGERVLRAAQIDRVPSDELTQRVAKVLPLPIGGQLRAGGSTWQSHARGRPLETPWIEGVIVRVAGQLGMRAPICSALLRASDTRERVSADAILSPAERGGATDGGG